MSDDLESDAHIRALLAELGSGPEGEAIPPEVAARLDDTLARLVAERDGSVVPLPRRWPARAAVAAAAVIVLGVGGVAVTESNLFDRGAPTSADSGAASDSREDTIQESAPEAVPRLTSSSFTADVEDLLGSERDPLSDLRDSDAGAGAREFGGSLSEAPNAQQGGACPGPGSSDGAITRQVAYDGRPAVLVIHPERGRASGWLVEAWDCAGTRKLDQTTVAATPR